MSKAIAEILSRLVTEPPSLLIAAGVLLMVLGFSGNVTYIPIADPYAKAGAIGVGLVLSTLGIILLFWGGPLTPYGVRIIYPSQNARVTVTDVKGTIRRSLPKDHQLWLVRLYTNQRFTPARQIYLRPNAKDWEVQGYDIGGKTDEVRYLAAWIVGPDGDALFKYWDEATKEHNDLARTFKLSDDTPKRFLPAIRHQTKDITECDRITVRRG